MNRPSNAGKISIRPQSIDKLDLSSKRLLVIGGTNGLGRAIAGLAMARGADVTVVGRTLREFPEGQPILKGISGRLGIARPAGAPQPRVFVMGSPGSGQLGNPDDLNSELRYKAMGAHANTLAGNEALSLGADGTFPGPAYFGLGPGLIKTGIRENWMGRDGGLSYRLFEGAVGLFLQSPDQYARRVVPLLFTPELNGRSGILFNRKARPTSPSKGFDAAYVTGYMIATTQLLNRALASHDQQRAGADESGRNRQPWA
jgi:hypothetical protein